MAWIRTAASEDGDRAIDAKVGRVVIGIGLEIPVAQRIRVEVFKGGVRSGLGETTGGTALSLETILEGGGPSVRRIKATAPV